MLTRFEHRRQKLISPLAFAHRMVWASLIWFAITVVGLAIGMIGYMATEGMGVIDAFANAAMILSGMGPLADMHNISGKIFAGCYAIFSGLVIVIASGFVLSPIFHRVLHRFHVETKDD
jgi:hypothetical protein